MGPSHKYPALFGVLLGLLAMACGESGAPTPPPPSPEAVQIVSGNNQRAATSQALASPLRVRVIGSDDQPMEGATVQWSVSQGQATLDPAQSITDAGGEAATRVTTGAAAGAIEVRATVEDLEPVSFTITALGSSAFISVSAGFQHTCAVTAAGDAYCWGSNLYGKLGDGSPQDGIQPTPVLVLGGLRFASVSAGGHHTCGITTGGAAYCWGSNAGLAPVPVASGFTFTTLITGSGPTCGLTAEGAAYCWDGSNTDPVRFGGDLRFIEIGVGNQHTCALTGEGQAYCWGDNQRGQLGDGTTTSQATPVPVRGDLQFVSLGVSAGSTCGVTAAGAAYCWGLNELAELGLGTIEGPEACQPGPFPCSTSPVPVVGGVSFTRLSGGVTNSHSCGVTGSGDAFCWGWNAEGQLGIGTTLTNEACSPSRDSPELPCSTVPMPVAGGLRFSATSAGAFHTCGVSPSGAVYCWGWNREGQLGDGTTTQRLTPVLVTIGE